MNSSSSAQPGNAPISLVFLSPQHPQGLVADAYAPQILVNDDGVCRGDGVFETMLARNGQVQKLSLHLSRLASSAAICELPIPGSEQWRAAIATALADYRQRCDDTATELVVRLTATRGVPGAGPSCWVRVEAVPQSILQARGRGVKVMLLDRGHDAAAATRSPWLLLGAKTLSYAMNMAALRYVRKHGADDVIFHTTDQQVLEGATSTVLMARLHDGGAPELITPLRENGVLPGTTQDAIFAGAKDSGWSLGYGPITCAELVEMDAVWLVSSVRLVSPVTHIDGQPVPQQPELTEALNEFLTRGSN